MFFLFCFFHFNSFSGLCYDCSGPLSLGVVGGTLGLRGGMGGGGMEGRTEVSGSGGRLNLTRGVMGREVIGRGMVGGFGSSCVSSPAQGLVPSGFFVMLDSSEFSGWLTPPIGSTLLS